jgi:TPR repeat protein
MHAKAFMMGLFFLISLSFSVLAQETQVLSTLRLAQVVSGKIYFEGMDAVKNDTEVFKWMLKAAKEGDSTAQYNVAMMYQKGTGVAQNPKERAKWTRKAAEQGLAQAQFDLGVIYFQGDGVAINNSESSKWFLKAAEQDYSDAQYVIGVAYYLGEGIPKDYIRSYIWLTISSEKGYLEATEWRDRVAKEMTEQQILEAQKLSKDWAQHKPHN